MRSGTKELLPSAPCKVYLKRNAKLEDRDRAITSRGSNFKLEAGSIRKFHQIAGAATFSGLVGGTKKAKPRSARTRSPVCDNRTR